MRVLTAFLISLALHLGLVAFVLTPSKRLNLGQTQKPMPVEVKVLEGNSTEKEAKKNLNKIKSESFISNMSPKKPKLNWVESHDHLKEMVKKTLNEQELDSLYSGKESTEFKKFKELDSFDFNQSIKDDVSAGTMSILNSDPGEVYYTFYKRISDLAVYRWTNKIFLALNRFDSNQLERIFELGKVWTTNVEFLLTPDGHYQSAHIMKESGISEFDRAAVMAFQEAGVFPNPPKEMVEEDGYVRLKVSFNVILNSRFQSNKYQ